MLNSMLAYIQSVKITDVFDILLIALFIYFILGWFRKSRARFMFIGMIALVLLYVVARVAGLYMTTMALQAFFAAAIIMVVVIFQDDFRHLFERIAIIGTTRKQRDRTSFDEIANILTLSLAELSKKKMGALLVVKGQDPLDRHLEAGVTLDGVLSQIMLESIFERHAPSHDGAAIVDEKRISMFGCHLPLSVNLKELGRTGTRHAAGLGLSERTDALCIIVSEEGGSISVAEDGRIKHLKDASELQKILREFYKKKFPDKKEAGFLIILTRNLPMRALAVILAAGLWMVFGHRTETIRRDFVVPIEYRNLAQNVVVEEPKSKDIVVTLSGREQDFDIRKSRDLKVSLDASGIRDGMNTIPITKDMIKGPFGFSVINVDPKEVELKTHRILMFDLPVEVKIIGHTRAGVTISRIFAEPKTVTVTVPSTVSVKNIAVNTEPVPIDNITETTTVKSKLITNPPIRFPDDKMPDVNVTIEVEKDKDESKKDDIKKENL